MHSLSRRLAPILAGSIAALALAAAPLAATSFVMVADRDLAEQAPLIITGRVVDTLPAVEPGGAPATDYTVAVDRSLKGAAGATTLTVRSPGGVGADGLGYAVVGAPRFAEGERVLLFLTRDAGGVHRVLHLMLGAFRERVIDGRPVWVREMGGATEVALPGRGAVADGVRDRDTFLRWLADRAAGVARPADYLRLAGEGDAQGPVGGEGPIPLPAGFTLFELEGLNLRWFDFDTAGVVSWQVHQDGQPGLTLPQTLAAFGGAMAAWSVGTPNIIRYAYGTPQTTTATGGLITFDGINAIVFDDPNDEIHPDFSCAGGGILAIGGPWFSGGPTPTWNGNPYWRIVGGDVVVNRGVECFFNASSTPVILAEELYGHELGHTLGIGHSCGDSFSPPCSSNPELNDALMRAFNHGGQRGARLNADDRGACNALYASRCSLFLEDGFESGDLSAWTTSNP